jgi:hypothetical protein
LLANGMTMTEASELVGIPIPDRLPADPPFSSKPRHCHLSAILVNAVLAATLVPFLTAISSRFDFRSSLREIVVIPFMAATAYHDLQHCFSKPRIKVGEKR